LDLARLTIGNPAVKSDNESFAGVGDDPNAIVQAETIPPDALAQIVRQAIEERMEDAERGQIVARDSSIMSGN